jgi:hypothetical protein
MRNKCDACKLILALAESYNMNIGTLMQPFQRNTIVEYVESGWINSIILFLASINGKIIINDYKNSAKN